MPTPSEFIHGASGFIDSASTALDGVNQIFLYNNIAITTLVVMCLFLIFGNIYQYRTGNKRQEKDFDRYVAVTKALAGVEGSMDGMQILLNIIVTAIQPKKDNGT